MIELSPCLKLLRLWFHRHRQRQQLREVSPETLTDIGISPQQARDEARKWFWQ